MSSNALLTDPNNLVPAQRRQADSASGVRHEVEEGSNEGDDTAVGRQAIANGAHSMLAHTIADVRALVRPQTRAGRLEVLDAFHTRQVAPR